MKERIEEVARLLEGLPSMRAAEGDDEAARMLDVYARATRDLRAVAVEARALIERAAEVVAEAREHARRRRRRSNKRLT